MESFKKLGALAAVALALTIAAPAASRATPTVNDLVAGTATQTESISAGNGGPTISPTSESVSSTVEFSPITTFSSPYSFTLAPQGSCFGSGCSTDTFGNKIETDTITLTFTNVQVNGHTVPTFFETGIFTAKYSGAELACAVGDGKSPSSGETDCLIWNGAPNTYNGSVTLFEPIPGMPGDDLEVTFFNATDWNISPSFEVAVVDAPVPEPASLVLLGSALVGFGFFRRRRKDAAA